MPQPQVNTVTARYYGLPGALNSYYWVQAIYPSGRSVLSSPALAPNIGSVNSGNNFVDIQWNAMPGAIGYDVIKTATDTVPDIDSTTTIGLVLGTTNTSVEDIGQTLVDWTYTVNA